MGLGVRSYLTVAATAAVLGAAGCGPDERTGTEPILGEPGLTWSFQRDVPDTINSTVVLRVQVRDSGGVAMDGVGVTFRPLPDSLGRYLVSVQANLFDIPPGPWDYSSLSSTVAADGFAATRVRLGELTGNASIRVTAGPWVEEIPVTIEPGQPVEFSVPAEIGVPVGSVVRPELVLRDRRGNAAGIPEMSLSSGPLVSVEDSGAIRGVGVGRDRLVAEPVGWPPDTVGLTVVPDATIYALKRDLTDSSPTGYRLVEVRLHGAEEVLIDEDPLRSGGVPTWHEGTRGLAFIAGERLLYWEGGVGPSVLSQRAADRQTNVDVSPDGDWLYYSRSNVLDGQPPEQARIRTDGSGEERVLPEGVPGYNGSLDPTGRFMVYQRGAAGDAQLWIHDLELDRSDSLGVAGHSPQWSPAGDWIAYRGLEEALRRVRPDGSDPQDATVSPPPRGHHRWSPDGRWLLVELRLLDVERGVFLSLPHLSHPNLHPLGHRLDHLSWGSLR